MIKGIHLTISALAIVGLSAIAQAQGIPAGARDGARDGNHAAGPVGAVVGGVIGGVVGGVGGMLGVRDEPRFREYVRGEHRMSYHDNGEVIVGTVLPDQGVEYYTVPQEYHMNNYRYTVVNGQTVIVDPRTRRIVQIIN